MRVAANISLLFTELPMTERPARARAAGFDGIEVLFPYDLSPASWQDALAGCPVALINTPPGDWAAGDRGWAAVPGATDRFRDGFRQALEMAQAMRAERIHVMAGNAGGPQARATFRANLEWACAQGHPLTIEPLNRQDMPGYFLDGYDLALRMAEGLPVQLQFDTWHAGRMRGVAAEWARTAARTGHVQIAGSAGRNEPGDDILGFVRQAVAEGYRGWISAEYRPAGNTAQGLGWLAALRGG